MVRRPIVNFRSPKSQAPRFCDVLVDGDDITLEVKRDKDKVETIAWEDLEYQVKVAKQMAVNK